MFKLMPAVVAATLLLQGIPSDSALRVAVARWLDTHQQSVVGELVDLLAIPNVAADRGNIRRNADRLRGMLAARGFTAEILETAGNPLVYGDLPAAGATSTLLLYSHYDGQPVEPKAWRQADPFTPLLRTARVDRGGEELANPSGKPLPEIAQSLHQVRLDLVRGKTLADLMALHPRPALTPAPGGPAPQARPSVA